MSAQEDGAYQGKPALSRAANERIIQRAARLRFTARVPVMCECSDPSCYEIFPIALDEYWRLRSGGGYLVAPAHTVVG